MGLGATVMCNCYAEGLIAKPEFDAFLIIDDQGYWDLNIPYEENPQLHQQLCEWTRSACTHEYMDFAHEHIGNWSMYRSFQQMLKQLGLADFPVMAEELPDGNGGLTDPAKARLILQELQSFSKRTDSEQYYALMDMDKDHVLYEYIESYEGIFLFGGTHHLRFGVDLEGFFIRDTADGANGKELFRSTHFQQALLEPELIQNNLPGRVQFVDNASGVRFECLSAIAGQCIPWPDGKMQNEQGQCRFSYPKQMCTGWRKRDSEDFQYVTQSLQKICEASIETGNPIRWV